MTPARRIARIRRWLARCASVPDAYCMYGSQAAANWERRDQMNELIGKEIEWLADYAEGKR